MVHHAKESVQRCELVLSQSDLAQSILIGPDEAGKELHLVVSVKMHRAQSEGPQAFALTDG